MHNYILVVFTVRLGYSGTSNLPSIESICNAFSDILERWDQLRLWGYDGCLGNYGGIHPIHGRFVRMALGWCEDDTPCPYCHGSQYGRPYFGDYTPRLSRRQVSESQNN